MLPLSLMHRSGDCIEKIVGSVLANKYNVNEQDFKDRSVSEPDTYNESLKNKTQAGPVF